MLESIITSPPFGNYIRAKGVTPVRGTYSWKHRPGLAKQMLKTVRPIKGGWLNGMGFRNPGIHSVQFNNMHLHSIVGLEEGEWDLLLDYIPASTMVEINLSCPNLEKFPITDQQIKAALNKFRLVSFKLSPTEEAFTVAKQLEGLGASLIHLSNTLPTSRGAESGKRLKPINLKNIEVLKKAYSHVRIIGGGGIYNVQDALDYKNAGADVLSLSTVWFNPVRGLKLLSDIKKQIKTKEKIHDKPDSDRIHRIYAGK